MTADGSLYATWLAVEFAIVFLLRKKIYGTWRWSQPAGHWTIDVGWAVYLHIAMTLGPAGTLRLQFGPAMFAAFGVYSLLANGVMVACALSIREFERSNLIIISVSVGCCLVVMGMVCLMLAMRPKMARTWWAHDSVKAYVSRHWDTRITARAGWGENLDAARAHVVISISHYHWPKEKVRKWLKENWLVWKDRPPPWFNTKVSIVPRTYDLNTQRARRSVFARRARSRALALSTRTYLPCALVALYTTVRHIPDELLTDPPSSARQWRSKLAKHAPRDLLPRAARTQMAQDRLRKGGGSRTRDNAANDDDQEGATSGSAPNSREGRNSGTVFAN